MLGMVVLPYNFIFEFCAPLVELLGIICYIYLIISHLINWPFALILLLFVYSFSILITLLSIVWDQLVISRYRFKEVLKLCLFVFLEPIIYHPLIMIFALIGYCNQFLKMKSNWVHMERKGFTQAEKVEAAPINPNYAIGTSKG